MPTATKLKPEAPARLPPYRLVATHELVGFKNNPRVHSPAQISKLAASITAFGFTNPILIDPRKGIIAGHGRLAAAQSLGLAVVPTIELRGLTEAQKRALVIADNALALGASWDDDLLASMLRTEGIDLALTGLDDLHLARLLGPAGGLTDPDDAPEVQAVAVSRLGDVWTLGRHTLHCADCRDVLPTLAGVDAVVTDPPYGMGWDTKSTRFSGGHRESVAKRGQGRADWGDVIADDTPFDPAPFLDFPYVAMWGANHYAQRLPVGTTLVWIKRLDDAFGSFLSDAEVAWVKGNHGVYCQRDTSLMATTNDRHHPTQKPVGVMIWSIEKAGGNGLILDPYCGSGTTLIAAEQMGRTCIACEIEPRYVDVCCRRFAAFTGTAATLDGRTFDANAAERASP